MASLLARRGPDRSGTWHAGPVGLGHTLLATTPEAVHEQLPLEHAASGCTITADVRLDNRDELLSALDLRGRAVIGDGEIVLTAYLAWGERCVERLLRRLRVRHLGSATAHALLRSRPDGDASPLLPPQPGPILRLRERASRHPRAPPDAVPDQRGAHRRLPRCENSKASTRRAPSSRRSSAFRPPTRSRSARRRSRFGVTGRSSPAPSFACLQTEAYAEAFLRGVHRGRALPTAQRRAGRVDAERRDGLRARSWPWPAGCSRLRVADRSSPSPGCLRTAMPSPRRARSTPSLTMDGLEPTTVSYADIARPPA